MPKANWLRPASENTSTPSSLALNGKRRSPMRSPPSALPNPRSLLRRNPHQRPAPSLQLPPRPLLPPPLLPSATRPASSSHTVCSRSSLVPVRLPSRATPRNASVCARSCRVARRSMFTRLSADIMAGTITTISDTMRPTIQLTSVNKM